MNIVEEEGVGTFPRRSKIEFYSEVSQHLSVIVVSQNSTIALRLLVKFFLHRAGSWDSVRSGFGCGQQHC